MPQEVPVANEMAAPVFVVAGVMLASSSYRHELEANIEPFKGLLLGLFFISVGASIDFSLLAREIVLILALVAILIASKFLVLLIIGRIFGFSLPDNLMFAFLLAQGGEFAFLLFSFATQNRVISPDVASILIVVVVLTMIATPLLIMFYDRAVRPRFVGLVEAEEEDDEIDADSSPVIVAGYGRFGQIVSRMLHADGINTTLLDHDSGQIELTGRFGYKVFYGDASRVQLLEAAGAEEARLLVVAIDNREKAVKMVVRFWTSFRASAFSTGITEICLPMPMTSTERMMFMSRSMLARVSVMISMLVSG